MKRSIRETTLADRTLFCFLILLSVSGLFLSREAMSRSSDVVIEQDGKPLYTLQLTVNKIVSVPGPCGNTLIEIEKGRVRVKEAHCPNRLCEKEGWVSKGVIVCLPNRIVIYVGGRGRASDKEIDAVTG